MILQDFECKNGHQFEKAVRSGQETTKCEECKGRASIVFLPRHRSQLREPIVFYKTADGKFFFSGRHDAPPPHGAVEKIECRTIGEYDKAMGRVNREEGAREERKAERIEQAHSQIKEQHRSKLKTMLANENDNAARDILRHALSEDSTNYERGRSHHVINEALEYYSSNREGEYRRGERDRK